MKKCTVCKQEKPIDSFYKSKSTKDGKSYRCKECDKKARQKWNDSNPEKAHLSQRERSLKHKYGVTLEWYNAKLKEQDYCCAICKIKENKVIRGSITGLNFAVDHDHDTGKVRGLLCNQCNRALGMFKDSPELIEKAIKYLERKRINDR